MKAPFAAWIGPTPNMTPGGMQPPLMGLVLHIQQGTEAGTESWFKNPAAQASSHFLNPKAGGLRQLVDTADKAWAQVEGNPKWISIENEGMAGDALTSSQIENAAQLLFWLSQTAGIPLGTTDSVSVPGLGWHGMGGTAWGGHTGCPGDPIKAQRGMIVDRARAMAAPAPNNAEVPVGAGYALLGKDGGIFAFGDIAPLFELGNPVGKIAPGHEAVSFHLTDTKKGYWIVASDGGIFAFGDAYFDGSMGGHPLNAPITDFLVP